MKKKLFYTAIFLLFTCGLYSQTPVEFKEISYGWVNYQYSWQISGYIYLDQPTTIKFDTRINGDLERNQEAYFYIGNYTFVRDKYLRSQDVSVTLGKGKHFVKILIDYHGLRSSTVATLGILEAVPGPVGRATHLSTL